MVEHTDLEYKDASQIAYLDFLEDSKNYLGPDREPYTIKELVGEYIDLDHCREVRNMLYPNQEFYYDNEIEELKSLIECSSISGETKATLLNISDDAYNWKYLKGRDHNSETGFCGYLLDTGKGDAMVAFRGSEGMKFADGSSNFDNWNDDWFDADFGLLEGETIQDIEAKQFSREVNAYLKGHPEYESINVAGHSLGGHLATEFTIFCAEDNIDLYNKIGKCANLDGPGRSIYYSMHHAGAVDKAQEKIYNYRASLVGEMLFDSSSSDHIKYVKIKDASDVAESNHKSDTLGYQLGYYAFDRHSLCYWEFDSEGNIIEGDPSPFAVAVGGISKAINASGLGIPLGAALNWIQDEAICENEYGELELTETGEEAVEVVGKIIGALVLAGAVASPVVAGIVVAVVAGTCLCLVGSYYWEKYGERVSLFLSNSFKKVAVDFSDAIEKFERDFSNFFDKVNKNLKRAFKKCYIKAEKHPHIIVDTELLKNYAERLDVVKQKIQKIDYMIDNLYKEVGLFDMVDLTITDLKIGVDIPIERSIIYLNTTADNFEKAEQNIKKAFQD